MGDGGGGDNSAAAAACQLKANIYNASDGQNKAFMAAACLYYCMYKATGDAQFEQLFESSQTLANNMCTAGVANCNNNIDRSACQ
jgi:hypothetical protein